MYIYVRYFCQERRTPPSPSLKGKGKSQEYDRKERRKQLQAQVRLNQPRKPCALPSTRVLQNVHVTSACILWRPAVPESPLECCLYCELQVRSRTMCPERPWKVSRCGTHEKAVLCTPRAPVFLYSVRVCNAWFLECYRRPCSILTSNPSLSVYVQGSRLAHPLSRQTSAPSSRDHASVSYSLAWRGARGER